MSLSSELRTKNSPINQFLAQFRPNVLAASEKIRNADGIIASIPWGHAKPYPYMMVGTAIDYRIRLYLTDKPFRSREMILGLNFLGTFGKLSGVIEYLYRDIDVIKPAGKILNEKNENIVCRYSVVMALADMLIRSFDELPEWVTKIQKKKPELILKSINNDVIADIIAMSVGFRLCNLDMIENYSKTIIGEELKGSSDVGGADFDFIFEDCIYDVKASLNPYPRLNDNIKQLLCYVLLDYKDAFKIKNIGLVLARQKRTHRIALSEIIGQKDLSELRKEFFMVVRSHRSV